jgi:hypothetical protein
VLEGTVIGECQPRHRHQEFLGFLNKIDQSIDSTLHVHLVLDNYGTHKHPEVKKWLADRSRYYVHFTPTSSSWLIRSNAGSPKSPASRYDAAPLGVSVTSLRPSTITSGTTTKSPALSMVASASQIIRKVRNYKESSDTAD